MDPVEKIRTRSREEWQSWLSGLYQRARVWVQDNGELALLGGLASGIIFVLLFRLIIGVLVFVLLGAFLVWHIALPDSEKTQSKEKSE